MTKETRKLTVEALRQLAIGRPVSESDPIAVADPVVVAGLDALLTTIMEIHGGDIDLTTADGKAQFQRAAEAVALMDPTTLRPEILAAWKNGSTALWIVDGNSRVASLAAFKRT